VNHLLEDARVDPSARDNEAIRYAAMNGHLGVVNRLLRHPRVDPSGRDNEAIRSAARNGHLYVVNRLLEDARVDPSAVLNNASSLAARNGHLDVVNRLLEDARVDPSAVVNYAIRYAAMNGHLGVVNRLLEDARVDPSAVDHFAIRLAARNGHLDVVSSLIGDFRVARTVRYSNLERLSDEVKIKSIVQSKCMKKNIQKESQFCEGSYQRIIRDPMVQSALKSQDMRKTFVEVCYMWNKMIDTIQFRQVRYLWNPKGPRARNVFEDWASEDKPLPGTLKRKGSPENNRVTKRKTF
jgi:hypothetical protein